MDAQRLARLTLLFALAFAALLISPALLSGDFGPFPLMKNGDVLDLVTPLVLIPLYWYLFRLSPKQLPSHKETVIFLILAALWVEGQGMHLAANSIGHQLGANQGTDARRLTHFYDEVLSHYLWHSAIVGLSALLIWRGWRHARREYRSSLWWEGVAGLIYGLTYFIIVVEARTAPVGVPYAALLVVLGIVRGRNQLRQQPLLAFFGIGSLVASALFAYWALRWEGLPEFSEVGIID